MNEINGRTRTCGLIGNPVEHTVSPVIHNNLAEMTGVDLTYVPFRVEEGRLEEAVKGAFSLNVLGLNVTVPYKSKVMSYVCETDELAAKIGAVNTLVRTEQGYKGYNTDMPGLYRALCTDGVSIAGETVIILGAGGVARAVALLMAEKGAERVILINRTLSKAEVIADEINTLYEKELVRAMSVTEYELPDTDKKYLCIQATNVGMYPHVTDTLMEDEAFYQKIHTGYDLIYNPSETMFMKKVKKAGGKAFNGLKMLLYQGIIAYELWTGMCVSDEMAEKVLKEMLKVMDKT